MGYSYHAMHPLRPRRVLIITPYSDDSMQRQGYKLYISTRTEKPCMITRLIGGLLLLSLCHTAQGFVSYSATKQLSRTRSTRMSAATTSREVHVQSKLHPNKVLEVTLSRPKQLNALSSQMLLDMIKILKDASSDPDVHAVLLTAVEGRAFCAGGDIKEIMSSVKARRLRPDTREGCDAERYITIEYELDSLIHHLSRAKPVVAVGDGIIMGGGAGVFQGAGIRVVTPRSLFAMPECRIALLPDAGAMYFLHSAPGQLPLYLALTGARLDGSEMHETGLATHLIPEDAVSGLLSSLRTCGVGGAEDVISEVAAREIHPAASPKTQLMRQLDRIDRVFGPARHSVRDVYKALLEERRSGMEAEWIDYAIKALESECPLSHVCTLHAIRTGQRADTAWDIDRGLGIEYVANCELGFRNDFIEGVDCTIGEKKGQRPLWSHSSWEEAQGDETVQALLLKMDGVTPVMDMIRPKKVELGLA